MIKAVKVTDLTEIQDTLMHLIASDEAFKGDFHPRPDSSLADKVAYDFETCSTDSSEFFRVKDGPITAGAFNFLYDDLGNPSLTFTFIHPDYRRDPMFKSRFWEFVWDNCLFDYFCVGIRYKNPRAQKFFESRGGLHLFDCHDPKNPGQLIKLFYFKRGVSKWA